MAGDFLEFTAEREGWNLYQIEDGTKLRIRLILTNVKRDGNDEHGNPKYLFQHAVVGSVEHSDRPSKKR